MKTNDEIWAMIKANDFQSADIANRERAVKHLTPKQVNGMIYYAHCTSHSFGDYEVCTIALNLLTDIAEA